MTVYGERSYIGRILKSGYWRWGPIKSWNLQERSFDILIVRTEESEDGIRQSLKSFTKLPWLSTTRIQSDRRNGKSGDWKRRDRGSLTVHEKTTKTGNNRWETTPRNGPRNRGMGSGLKPFTGFPFSSTCYNRTEGHEDRRDPKTRDFRTNRVVDELRKPVVSHVRTHSHTHKHEIGRKFHRKSSS